MRASSLALFLVLGIACASGGCGSPGQRGAAPEKAERKPQPPTPEQQALLDAYDAGEEAWEPAREKALADPELARFMADRLVLEMVHDYEGIAGADGQARAKAFDRAQAELVRFGEPAAPLLASLLVVSDGVVATLSARTLERIGRPAVAPVVALTRSSSVRTRQRATEVLERLPHAGPAEDDVRARLTEMLRSDPEWTVRALAAKAMGEHGAQDRVIEPWRRALEAALDDKDPAVTEAAALALAKLDDPLAVPALLKRLERAVSDGDLRQVKACQGALHAVTHDPGDHDLDGWRAWWFAHRDALRGAGGGR